jgi:alpha-tubulin suppressor-like RCC1 family protein
VAPLERARNVASVATGFATTCVRSVSGNTQCWGDNRYGQLSDPDTSVQDAPVAGYDDGFAIATGGNFSCALLKYVVVRCWGSNEYGQLGDGTTTASAVPQTVRSNEEVVHIAAGAAHVCQIITDGTVRCWGHNNFGQLGNEATEDSSTPVVAAVQSVVGLSLGQSHSCALLQDGGGACWGRNEDGQLGSGNTANSGMPLRVADLQNAVALASGGNHTCAITQNTSVVCWGRNEQAQLGIGTSSPGISVPAAVPNLVGVTALTAGSDHTCALRDDGTVWCWGWNRFGQTGVSVIGEKSYTLSPVQIRDLSDVISVQAGGNHTCALKQSGLVRCWGDNYNGQLGVERTADATFDTLGRDIVGLDSVLQIATGGAHTCVLQQRGNVSCWGWNRDGQLGTGTRTERVNVHRPTPIVGQSAIVSLALGDGHLCDVDSNGTVWCWGDNEVGQLGIGVMGNNGNFGLPNEVDAAVNTLSVDLGGMHSCALLETAELNCWGRNTLGQLGNSYAGDIADSVVPNFVVGVNNVSAYSAGGDTSCAVAAGIVSCWGDNEYGQLATATVGVGDYRTTASVVVGLDAVIDVSVGRHHVCALRDDRTVWCWGRNNVHQIAETENLLSVQPIRIPLSTPIASLSTSADHTCAIDTEGTVWCWGNNQSGQLSVVGESIRTIQKVAGIPPARAIAAAAQHTCMLDREGAVWCWGSNEQGQVGMPLSTENINIMPTRVENLTDVRAIATGGQRSCALRTNGEVWCWGENTTGQLGVSPNPDRHVPAIVTKLWTMRVSSSAALEPTMLPVLPTIQPSATPRPTSTAIPTRTLIRVAP